MDKCEYDELISLLAQCRVLATPHPGRPDNGFHIRRLCQVVERHALPALNYGEARDGWTILGTDGLRYERTFPSRQDAADRQDSCQSATLRQGVVLRVANGVPVAPGVALLWVQKVLPILDGMIGGDGYAPPLTTLTDLREAGRRLVEVGA